MVEKIFICLQITSKIILGFLFIKSMQSVSGYRQDIIQIL